jgi:Carboxypeptidase regulatory-like domain/TonB dependent receptor
MKHGVLFSTKWGTPVLVFVLAIALSFVSAPLYAQGSAGRIIGTVTDSNGGAVAGATVSVLDVARGTTRTLTTDEAGVYSAPNLLPGTYKVHVEFKGFKTLERQNLTLEVGQDLRVDVVLQPGEQAQTITVTETVPLVETTNASLGGTVTNQTINELPLNGRNYQNLLSLRPGVQIYPGGGAWTQSTNGLRAHDNVYMVEGIDHSDPWLAQSVINAVGFAGDAATILSMDAIQEFKTEQNPRAEFGWKPGSQVNVGIKSGTNTIHGTAFAFGRSDAWDARNYFNTSDQAKEGIAMEQFGGTAGGRIIKDKLFWFGDYEGQRYTLDSGWIGSAPITAAGIGDASTNLILGCQAALPANGGTGVTALSAHLAGLNTDCTQASGYPGVFPANSGSQGVKYPTGLISNNTSDSGLGKIDYHINDKNSLSGTFFDGKETGIFADDVAEMQPFWRSLLKMDSLTGNANWTYTPTSTLVNEVRWGYARFHEQFLSVDHDVEPFAGYGINTGVKNPNYFGFPVILLQGQFSNGFQLGGNWPKTVGPDTVMQFTDHVSLLRGNHSFKFGGDILLNTSENNVTARAKGDFRFGQSPTVSSLQNFFQGNLNRARLTVGDAERHLSSQGYSVFLQDDWRIRPRFTLNLGVRYEINTVIRERDNLEGNFDPVLGAVQVGNQIPNPYNGDHNNFSPRVGFAWDMFGTGKTVLRGGGNIIYESLTYDAFMALGNLVGLRTVPTGAFNCSGGATGSCADPTGNIAIAQLTFGGNLLTATKNGWKNNSATTPVFPSVEIACGDGNTLFTVTNTKPGQCVVSGADYNLKTPYVASWNLGIQQAIGNNLSLDVSYVGNHGTKLIHWVDTNNPGVGAGWGNSADPTTPAGICIASAPTGFDNCTSDPTLALVASREDLARPFHGRFPYYSFIEVLGNHDTSNYNGLQMTLTGRNYHGLSFVAGYTYSHSLDVASDNWGGGSGSGIYSDTNPASHYGNSSFDITHRFTLSATYNFPSIKTPGQLLEGWSINNIVTLQGGQPWWANDLGNDISGTGEIGSTGVVGEFWDYYGPKSAFTATHGLTPTAANPDGGIPFFPGTSNADCLAKATANGTLALASLTNFGCYATGGGMLLPPAFGTLGNAGKGIWRGPGFHNWDFSVTKAFKFGDRLTTQFRAEFFNVLNHPEFVNAAGGPAHFLNNDPSSGAGMGYGSNTPDVAATNPVFGSGGPRSIQLGLKLIF